MTTRTTGSAAGARQPYPGGRRPDRSAQVLVRMHPADRDALYAAAAARGVTATEYVVHLVRTATGRDG